MTDPSVVVFRDSVGRNTIALVAHRHGWKLLGDVVRGHFVLASERFAADDGTIVEYLEDHTAAVRFAQIRGPGQGLIASTLRNTLPYFEPEEILRNLPDSDDPHAWIRGLSRLSACRPSQTHARYLALWSRGLNHAQVAVRRAAIRTSYGCSWPELMALVQGRAAVEAELKAPLRALLQHLKTTVGSTPRAER